MLIDASLLLFAVDEAAADHKRASDWLEAQLNGDRRVGIPWESITAFVRIITNPRASDHPMSASEAWTLAEEWLGVPSVWLPLPTERHADVLGGLVRKYNLVGNLIPDAHLAAIALEHGLSVASADTDFARFSEIRWVNPLAD